MKLKISIIVLFFYTIQTSIAFCQDKITIEDYNRAVGFMYENINNKQVFNIHVIPNWFSDSTGVWYTYYSTDGKKYIKVTFPDVVQSDLFDHDKLAKILSDSLGRDIKPNNLPLDDIQYKSNSELLLTTGGMQYILNTVNTTLTTQGQKKTQDNEGITSPDKKWIAYTLDYNLFIRSSDSTKIKQLSAQGEKGFEYASWYGWFDLMQGENGERPNHFTVDWSENSEWIYSSICDLRSANKMYLLDWSQDTLYRPNLISYYRGSPGDTGMVYQYPTFFNVNSGKEIRPDLPRTTHINPIDVEWSKTPGKVFLKYSERGFQKVIIYSFDLNTEKLELLYSETSATNIDQFYSEFLEDSNLMFFLSEKSGWRQLYSLNLKTKEEKAITQGEYFIHSIENIDEKNKIIYFLAAGKEQGQNPYYKKVYSVSFDGKRLNLLTPENCHHSIYTSPDGKYFLDNYSTVNELTNTVLRNSKTGKVVLEIAKADISKLKDWNAPEIFTAIANDGKTTLYGAVWRPSNFDPNKSYPVIESSYTGPHTQVFPKNFSEAFWLQSYAELGFVVVKVDGRGSSGRSKEFHNYSYKNLGGSLEDHVSAIKQLGRKYSWVDTTRVGIFGHSAGGYDAGHAVLAYPEFYKVAVASSADHDHRMEKAWWPEMYMGWPVDSAYHNQSNITMAGNLKGKLLLVHGGLDENVNPSATFKLAEALVKADKQFDMLILPSQHHGYRGVHQKYFTKLRWNYFVEHLRGVDPIWDFKWK